MIHHKPHSPTRIFCGLLFTSVAFATNPLIMDQFTADPTARVFEGRIYVYPSHDIKAPPEYKGRPNWFCMEDYHVFSSDNLTDWKDHGVIVRQTDVPWANPSAYAMWAPDCVFKDGKYYFYFPATAKGGGNRGGRATANAANPAGATPAGAAVGGSNPAPGASRGPGAGGGGGGFRIGVAVADRPYGPFKLEENPIEGVRGIDPCVLIDQDGSAYLYFSQGKIFVAKLKANMTELEGPVLTIDNLPTKGLLEGPFVFARNGVYYLTYPHVENKTERLEYATSDKPMGPYKPAGVILDESASGCWTVHHSLIEYQGQWYLFYHDKDLSPGFDKNRAIRADKLWFNADGTIRKVIPTLRGVGVVNAQSEIQIDRYSAISATGASVMFLDEKNPHAGWKVALAEKNSWVQFSEVDFGAGAQKSVSVRSSSATGGAIEIRLDKPDGPLVAQIAIEKNAEWKTVQVKAEHVSAGIHTLVVSQTSDRAVEVDWVRFQ